jgi:hypothetical protein
MARVANQRGGRGYYVVGRVLGQGCGDGRGNYPGVGDGGVLMDGTEDVKKASIRLRYCNILLRMLQFV